MPSLVSRSRVLAEVEPVGVEAAEALGFYRLTFKLQISVLTHQNHDVLTSLMHLGGDVHAGGEKGDRRLLGSLIPNDSVFPWEGRREPRPSEHQVFLDLRSAQIAALERMRLAHAPDHAGVRFVTQLKSAFDTGGEVEKPGVAILFVVNQSDWLKLLEQMGYQRTLLLEVPLKDDDVNPGLAAAGKDLFEAHSLLQHGRWRTAVGQCRHVLEHIGHVTGDTTRVDPAFNSMFERINAMGKKERLVVIRRALLVMTHLANHSKDDVTIEAAATWNPEDAAAMVAMTSALLRWVDQFEEHPFGGER